MVIVTFYLDICRVFFISLTDSFEEHRESNTNAISAGELHDQWGHSMGANCNDQMPN